MQLIKNTFENLPPVSITGEAEELRNNLVLSSMRCKTVLNAGEQDQAVQIARDIRTHIKEVEATRAMITKPLLETQRLLKAAADEHVGPLLAEQKRIERLVTDFQVAEQKRVEAEERKRREEFLAAQKAQFEAEEKARKLAEAARSESGLNKAIKAEEKYNEATAKVQEIIAAPEPMKFKAAGAATRKVMKYEVTDVKALYAARPELCELTPKPAAIRSTCSPEVPVPGLRCWWEMDTSIRAY